MSAPEPYDPVPDLARIMRLLEWSPPVDPVAPGSIYGVHRAICAGLGVVSPQTAIEYEQLLYRQLGLLPRAPDHEGE